MCVERDGGLARVYACACMCVHGCLHVRACLRVRVRLCVRACECASEHVFVRAHALIHATCACVRARVVSLGLERDEAGDARGRTGDRPGRVGVGDEDEERLGGAGYV